MGQAVPSQHPAVVLRSQFNLLRALLAAALLAVTGLTLAVIVVAGEDDRADNRVDPIGHIDYGGFNPATGRPQAAPLPQQEHPLQSTFSEPRYDGGPEEGTPEITVNPSTGYPTPRYDGGPEEGTPEISVNPSTGYPTPRYDGGPEEGTRGAASHPSSSAAADGSAYGQLRRAGALAGGQPTERYDGGPEEGSRGPASHSD